MALPSTVYTLSVELADVDRGHYASFDLRVAQHPSETAAYLVTRVLAYLLEHTDGIAFAAEGISGSEPPIAVRDPTGRLLTWVEIGMPDADRVHRASKAAERVVIYTHREPRQVLRQLEGRGIHRAEDVAVLALDRGFIDQVAEHLARRTALSLSVVERQLFLTIGKRNWQSALAEHRLA